MSIPTSAIIQQFVFENQRRSFLIPFPFKASSLSRFERPNFSDENGEQTQVSLAVETAVIKSSFPEDSEEPIPGNVDLCTIDCPAPPGFEWSSDWSLDKTYSQCDDEGWSYGVDFLHITDCLKRGASIRDPIPHSVRRRKWVRDSVRITDITPQKDNNKIQISRGGTGKRICIELSEKLKKSCKEFIIYENQRRGLIPPFSFSDSNLSRFERPAFSDENGESFQWWTSLSIIGTTPPPGFEWVSDWNIDKTYTQCDEEGWSYGVDFLHITDCLKRGASIRDPIPHSVRRRKWVRTAMISTDYWQSLSGI